MASSGASILETSVIRDADCERVFKRFTFKCLQIIVQSRIERPVLQGKDTTNDYFSINLPDSPSIDEQIKQTLEGIRSYPIRDKTICVEIALRTNDGDHMFLETWDLSFSLSSLDMSASKIQHIFTRMGLTLKSLLSATRAVPAYRLARNQGEKGGGYKLNYRFYLGPPKTHLLGEDYKTVRAGALPSAYGLLSITLAYRTKLLLSPDTSSSCSSIMQVTDNHFMKEHAASGHRQQPQHTYYQAYSEPKPCYSSFKRRSSLSSPDYMAAPLYCYSVSPSSQGTEEDLMSKMSVDNPTWPLTSILNMEELPEPAVGAFSAQRPNVLKVEEKDLPFEGLMKRSILARREQRQRQELREREEQGGGRVGKTAVTNEEEKENMGALHMLTSNPPVEEDYVIVDPPFACDDDPRDVKSFLGAMFRAPHLYDVSDMRLTVDDYLSDVSEMMSRLEDDMPVLDEFCQSVINFNSTEDEDAGLFS